MSTETLSLRPPRTMNWRAALTTITLAVTILLLGAGFWLASMLFFGSGWAGVLLTFAVVAVLTLLVLGLVAYTLRQWQNTAETSYRNVLWYVFQVYLWPRSWSLAVEGGELKGLEQNKNLFESFGGPGWLFIYPGHIVVFHKLGKITRMADNGWVKLKSGERIKAILPLGPQRNVFSIERLLTRDRIHLGLEMNYIVEIEKAPDTFKRLKAAREEARSDYVRLQSKGASLAEINPAIEKYQEASQALSNLAQDKILGEGKDSFYESVLKTVAIQASKVKEALKTSIEMQLRDIVMTQTSDEMVLLAAGGTTNLVDNVSLRRIEQVEDSVQKQEAKKALKRGLVLKKVDITNIEYPDDIKPKINEEVGAVIDARIQRIGSRTKVEGARADATAQVARAKAEKEAAVFKAAARHIMSQEKTQQYKNLIAALQRSGLPQSIIGDVLVNMTSSDVVEFKLNQILELTNQYIQEKSPLDS